ncbi:hypothetical protein [Mesorhizobium sp. B2-3-2]|uniref:hypothetical protein n=1 Tax=Mesorhizobium sp. B2-3-2 TaxID=2589961 RepID=UPI001125FE47|nr:hypothetical protein [Mesorhizobium sp. B2-3-2]TPM37026.1 hypothetical protein FJ964_30280 [Mesorhizobium sp. B2-3-2]
MNAAAATRIFTVCREATRDFVMRIDAESEIEAKMVVSRMTGWRFDSLTTQVKPSAVIYQSDEDCSNQPFARVSA